MKHNIENMLMEYAHIVKRETFGAVDLAHIRKRAVDRYGQTDIYTAIIEALQVGYVAGYRAAIREQKKSHTGGNQCGTVRNQL